MLSSRKLEYSAHSQRRTSDCRNCNDINAYNDNSKISINSIRGKNPIIIPGLS